MQTACIFRALFAHISRIFRAYFAHTLHILRTLFTQFQHQFCIGFCVKNVDINRDKNPKPIPKPILVYARHSALVLSQKTTINKRYIYTFILYILWVVNVIPTYPSIREI